MLITNDSEIACIFVTDFRPFNENFISNSLYYIIESLFLTLQMENEGNTS